MEVAVVFFVVGVGGGGLYRIEGLVAGGQSDDEVDEGINEACRSARSQLRVVDVDLVSCCGLEASKKLTGRKPKGAVDGRYELIRRRRRS